MNAEFNDWYYVGSNKIHKTSLINWDQLEIGTNNVIGPYVCIGTDAQHIREPSTGKVKIGNNNIFREYSTVHLPTRFTNLTSIGNDCYFMALSHIAHDCTIEDKVVFSNNVTLGGHTYIMRGSQFGFNAIIHQYQVIGSYCMLGMGTIVPKNRNITSGTKWVGNPAKLMGKNEVGLKRNGLDVSDMVSEDKRRQSIINERYKY